MKTYRILFFAFVCLLVIYIVAEYNRPSPVDWTLTLQKQDKKPYGAYILFKELKQLFPQATISTERQPVYNVLQDNDAKNTAYLLIAPELDIQETDMPALLDYMRKGNYVFMAAAGISKKFIDTLGIEIKNETLLFETDSCNFNLTNPYIKSTVGYTLHNVYSTAYISEIHKRDSCVLLGRNNNEHNDFMRIQYGNGALYLHTNPQCFSNHFMLTANNYTYTSKALSYLPSGIKKIYWDEYYKQGRTGSTTPLRYFLSNTYLKWALWISIIGFIIYILLEMKRRQRVIPVIEPPRNTSLEFVQTVAGVYLSHKNNATIANKKIQFWLDNIKRNYYISATELNDDFAEQLSKKRGTSPAFIKDIIHQIQQLQTIGNISDGDLIALSKNIDTFYTTTKIRLHE